MYEPITSGKITTEEAKTIYSQLERLHESEKMSFRVEYLRDTLTAFNYLSSYPIPNKVVDLTAHIGGDLFIILAKLFKGAKMYAFEINKKTSDVLTRNAEKAKNSVTIYNQSALDFTSNTELCSSNKDNILLYLDPPWETYAGSGIFYGNPSELKIGNTPVIEYINTLMNSCSNVSYIVLKTPWKQYFREDVFSSRLSGSTVTWFDIRDPTQSNRTVYKLGFIIRKGITPAQSSSVMELPTIRAIPETIPRVQTTQKRRAATPHKDTAIPMNKNIESM
jgi:hypothetical protein